MMKIQSTVEKEAEEGGSTHGYALALTCVGGMCI